MSLIVMLVGLTGAAFYYRGQYQEDAERRPGNAQILANQRQATINDVQAKSTIEMLCGNDTYLRGLNNV